MIIVRLLSTRAFLVGWHHQSLLGCRSRRCHGISVTHNQSEMLIMPRVPEENLLFQDFCLLHEVPAVLIANYILPGSSYEPLFIRFNRSSSNTCEQHQNRP